MKKRYKPNQRKQRKMFKKTVGRTHYFNTQMPIMRGGIRL